MSEIEKIKQTLYKVGGVTFLSLEAAEKHKQKIEMENKYQELLDKSNEECLAIVDKITTILWNVGYRAGSHDYEEEFKTSENEFKKKDACTYAKNELISLVEDLFYKISMFNKSTNPENKVK